MYKLVSTRNLSIFGIMVSVFLAYQAMMSPKTDISVAPPLLTSSIDIQMPSAIPNMYLAAKRHTFSVIDLRRVDLLVDMQPESDLLIQPLLDSVLFVPKKFVHGRALAS